MSIITSQGAASSSSTADDYVVFCEGLRRICGVDLTQYRRPQMERRLRTFFSRLGIEDLAETLPMLRADGELLDNLLDRVTINVSQLWRHPAQITHLEQSVLPELAAGTSRVRIWSAGCSYGAEAYTIAAVCRSCIPTATVSILGTDIDRRMVERAQGGRFSLDDARAVPEPTMRAAFDRVQDGWQAHEALRRMMRFEIGDLLRLQPRPDSHDLVVCRNTVIYFSEPVRDTLHERLTASLRPGGYLLVGATERVANPASLGLTPTAPFFYRKDR
ncbi:MAG TPA: protein-glutamate O-methyltransferase CheR [Solirubrobacteraceae bacterium]|nr:protein-glutamate O-methyltransferase CheR [Solirubrobacteraceae bacterium]